MIFEIDDTAEGLYFPDSHLFDDDGCFAASMGVWDSETGELVGGRYISYEEYMKIMNENQR